MFFDLPLLAAAAAVVAAVASLGKCPRTWPGCHRCDSDLQQSCLSPFEVSGAVGGDGLSPPLRLPGALPPAPCRGHGGAHQSGLLTAAKAAPAMAESGAWQLASPLRSIPQPFWGLVFPPI